MIRARFRRAAHALAVLGALMVWAAVVAAQSGQLLNVEKLVRVTTTPVTVAAGGRAVAIVEFQVAGGWHVNANPPALDYLIPTEIELEPAAGVRAETPKYPPPHRQKLAFEESELLVYDGRSRIELPLRVDPGAVAGTHELKGKIGYQACNDQVCLPPADVSFTLVVTVTPGAGGAPGVAETTIVEAAPSPITPDPATTGAPRQGGFTTTPPSGGSSSAPSILNNPIAKLFERGSATAFVWLFFIGLALNLTPCVYPMLGVTVSIFGARRAAPPAQVVGFALLYVLGIALMYSTLGLVAGLTGSLFGSFLQSPFVLAGIGLLMIALSLSMFGLYEFQLPPELLSKLGGTGATSAVGIFGSGVVVGLVAAPCVGPPITALVTLVAAKGDPWFGFSSFFVLAMGLGAPYLLLATFSNLIQQLPRSGDWMVWVKKVFGIILLAVGAFYVLLAVAPKWSGWVMPAALIAGGLYLGFLEKSAVARRGFQLLKWATGVLAVGIGVFVVVTTPTQGLTFRAFSPDHLQAGLAQGRPAMLDFSADWCLPCHELERSTFTDRRVIAAARAFHTYKVDLTRFNSPEAERWRREYRITGVPTIVFIDPDGREIKDARVEGFVPAAFFLERMRLATQAAAKPQAQVQ
ncbi:MAG TPA: cytochrome c biogenesis protein CcdA [Candidatus Limnocylindria bacterium]|nr:cytochrome c biogenesis protein CcdA [Candidatus Limnocylindria bacterium]